MPKNRKGTNPPGKLRKRARRDVRVAYQPQFDAIERERQRAQAEAAEAAARNQQVYASLAQALAPLYSQYQQQAAPLAGQLTEQLGALSGMAGANSAGALGAGEAAAAQGAFGAIGAGGQQLLASDQLRNLSYLTSAQSQAPMEGARNELKIMGAKQRILEDLRAQRMDLKGQMGPQVLSHLDALRDQRTQNRFRERELSTAEQQFEKTFGLQERAANQDLKTQRGLNQLTRSRAEIAGDKERIKPIRKDIQSLRSEREDIQGRAPTVESNTAVGALNQKIQRKRKRIKKIKRRNSPNY